MNAIKIILPVTPYRTSAAHLARLRALDAPAFIIDRAEARADHRTDLVRERVSYTGLKSIAWQPAYTELVGEEEWLYLAYTGKTPPVRLIANLVDLCQQGIATTYECVTIKNGVVHVVTPDYECPACQDQGCFRCLNAFQLTA